MKTRAALLFAGLVFAVPVAAQVVTTTDPAVLEAGDYTMDPGHARILFGYKHQGFSTSYGFFALPTAKLHFEPKDLAKSTLEVDVDLNNIDTTVPKLDAHLKSEDFFDVAKFPTAVFKATKVVATSATAGTVTGDLTLHGVTKPVTLNVTFSGGATVRGGYTLGFDATTVIKRSDFGVKTYVPMVGDDVTLTISAEFHKG